jgi:two-component system NtrC family sensor kinase
LLSKWPIRVKLLVGLGLLVLVVGILASSGLHTMYAYRGLVSNLRWRVPELPVAAELSRHVGDLRVTLSELHGLRANTFPDAQGDEVPFRVRMVRDQFESKLAEVEDTLAEYCRHLDARRSRRPRHQLQSGLQMSDNEAEWETVKNIEAALARVHEANCKQDWMLDDVRIMLLDEELRELQALTAELPSYLHEKLLGYKAAVTGQYRVLIVGTWITIVSAALFSALFVQLSWKWILRPLRILIHGSRRVASGQFDYRIHLETDDEMSELADALNDMTARFQAIRDDLDAKVQERTRQVVRSEQLASVGFLAAGVAHEINNPLASIAMCAESLEGRVHEMFEPLAVAVAEGGRREELAEEGAADRHHLAQTPDAEQYAVISNYLQLIQKEAFRCKEITEKLLDFSRIGPLQRQDTDLGELVQDMVDMLRHLGKYQQKQVEYSHTERVVASVNPQEIKQVVLNLLTNGLDSVGEEGTVRIDVRARGEYAELTFSDDGCGMEPEVLRHVFEPFFTRRRGGQGTGLGLSITYRIVADHGGTIEAESAGSGRGATFRVRLPLAKTEKETQNRYQAA